MKNTLRYIGLFLLVGFLGITTSNGAATQKNEEKQKRVHTVFFEGTDHELHVFRVFGNIPGKTLMIIGGIQGDEPGGFISADLYADFSLKKGNLIVVPRANFYSILLNQRSVNEDMNRKFADDEEENYEAKIVTILKQLIGESDCLLNLHDGSGFYAPTFIDDQRNPKRYGQSIISDCERYIHPDTGETIALGEMARSIIAKMNLKIKENEYRFHFNNHRTSETSTYHKEQRKSATYYALYTRGIPAFGIETSKKLPIEFKVKHHILAVNAFMEMLGVEPESPGIYLDRPLLSYLVISINDNLPIVVKNKQTLFLEAGDEIKISHIESNYERGLSADIMSYGGINDLRKKVKVTKPTRIAVKKDFHTCGTVYVGMGKRPAQNGNVQTSVNEGGDYLFFKVEVNGIEKIYQNYDDIDLIRGDAVKIVDVITGRKDPSELVVNVKGYVGDRVNNTGEDRGFLINTASDFWKRYSMGKKGKKYQVIVSSDEVEMGKVMLQLHSPRLDYLILSDGNGGTYCAKNGQKMRLDPAMKTLVIDQAITNISGNHGVRYWLKGSRKKKESIARNTSVDLTAYRTRNSDQLNLVIEIERENIQLGTVHLF
ncbi:M14/M99 family metallopeptidase [Desulfobacterales bacterium HSG17]|nr:M14/M99 family metallopeptidase [Desulfobacterales bacterium HSG17]